MTKRSMCTVTLIPTENNNFILTSNRDESVGRKTLLPEFYEENNVRILYPKDAVAGGTWIGVSDKSNLVCLLNGGFKNHKRLASYRQSRGVVVKKLLTTDNMEQALEEYQCDGIEPFTIVTVSWRNDLRLFEMVWDGTRKHVQELPKEPKIWSSSTLYTAEMKAARQEWFADFKDKGEYDSLSLLDFHKQAGVGDDDMDLVMDRGVLKTCSITQVVKNEEHVTMRYEDLQKSEVNTIIFEAITV